MEAIKLPLYNPVGTTIIYTGILFACIAAIALVAFLAKFFNCKNCCCRRRQDGLQECLIEEGRYPRPNSYYSTSTTAWTTTNETLPNYQYIGRPRATTSPPRYSVIRPVNQSTVVQKQPVLPAPVKYRNAVERPRNEGNCGAVTSAPKSAWSSERLKNEKIKITKAPVRKIEDRPPNGTPVSAPRVAFRAARIPKVTRRHCKRPVPIPPNKNALRMLRTAGGAMPDIDKLDGINIYTPRLPTRSGVTVRGNSSPRLLVPTKRRATKNVPRSTTAKLHSLIIATDATPDNVGGYCIDFAAHTGEYYSFPTSMLPKCLAVKSHFNSAEFEMNNLAFALLYWEPLILERQRLLVYTDNNSIRENGISPEHGEKVRAYLDHLENCADVTVLNKLKHHINRNHRPADFEKYIVPADNLSRGNIEEFHETIVKSFPKITKCFQLDRILMMAKEVQQRWENCIKQPCHCEVSSFHNQSGDERDKWPLVGVDRNNGNTKVPKVKRLNRR